MFRPTFRTVLKNINSRKEREMRARSSRRPCFESLEDRRLFVVGAFAPPPALAPSEYSGVVKLSINTPGDDPRLCSGTLLPTGQHILTAAHCLTNDNGVINSTSLSVRFETDSGVESMTVRAQDYTVHPSWNGSDDGDFGYDLAVLRLPWIAPADATRHELYRESNEVGQGVVIVGYGKTGSGYSGATTDADGERRMAWNTIEGESYDNWYQSGTGGPDGKVLWYDFDETLGRFEGMAAKGDSGGPAFINGRIAGVTSAGFETNFAGGKPECEFGEDATVTRVSAFADWIDWAVGVSHTAILNMQTQPGGADGTDDAIEVRHADPAKVEVVVNGVTVAQLRHGAFEQLILVGSSDNERFALDTAAYRGAVVGGGGSDTLKGPDRPTDWQISGPQSGSLAPQSMTATFTFYSIEAIVGGASTDRFYLDWSFFFTGSIDGGGGASDRLDYSSFSTSVSVDLMIGSASLIGRGVRGFEQVRGGSNDDILRGDDRDNRLEGGAGDDQLFGEGGSDTLIGGDDNDRLFGGSGVDALYGQEGCDYLDGGRDGARDRLYGGGDRDVIVRYYKQEATFSYSTLSSYSTHQYTYYQTTNYYDSVYASQTNWVLESQYDDYDPGEDILISQYWDWLNQLHHVWYDMP